MCVGIRFKLPCRIPPTYKGSAIRFQYQVQVQGSCRYPGETDFIILSGMMSIRVGMPQADVQLCMYHYLSIQNDV